MHSLDSKKENTAKPFVRYLFYALGEIVLVVAGILIALQINNWNTRRIESEIEKKIYQNVRRQIIDDKNELLKVRDFNNYYTERYEIANRIISSQNRSKIDSLAYLTMTLSQYSDFHGSGKIYETLVNGGEIKLLKNSDITSQLQQLEMTYTNLNRLEEIHWAIIINELSPEIRGVINYSTLKVIKPEKLFSVEIQNFIIESIYLTKGKETVYKQVLDEIDTVIVLIDKELNIENQ